MSILGNGAVVGTPTAANPITAGTNENALAFSSFENLVGAATQDDWFDLRDGGGLSGTIDGGGEGTGGDTLDLRD